MHHSKVCIKTQTSASTHKFNTLLTTRNNVAERFLKLEHRLEWNTCNNPGRFCGIRILLEQKLCGINILISQNHTARGEFMGLKCFSDDSIKIILFTENFMGPNCGELGGL